MLKIRDWTTRKSRDFNEEYPKLRFLLNPDFSPASVFVPVAVTHLCVCIALNQTLSIISFGCISRDPSVHVKSSAGLSLLVCLSVCFSVCLPLPLPYPSLPPLGSIPGYFPTQMSYLCWEHVSLLLPLTPSSSHTGCLMAPSTTFCMKAPVSTSTLVTKSVLVTSSGGLQGFVINCTYCTVVTMLPSPYAEQRLCCHRVMW